MNADHEIDALVADQYLDALLSAGERHADDAPADAVLEPGLRDAARVLRRSLVRVHPSFRFEERLAARLSGLAAAQAAPLLAASGAGGAPLPFPPRPGTGSGMGQSLAGVSLGSADPLLEAILRGDLDPADAAAVDHASHGGPDRRPLLVGGAITSAAISLVGVAIVAWRATRPSTRPTNRAMARAARAARARRTAGSLAANIGSLGGPA